MESVIAIIGVFFVPAALIVLIMWFRSNERRRRYQLQADLYAKALEKGQSVPADLFDEHKIQKKGNPLNSGIICIAAGVGISLLFVLMAIGFRRIEEDAFTALTSVASVGVIPFFIGVAYLIIHFIEKKKTDDENAK